MFQMAHSRGMTWVRSLRRRAMMRSVGPGHEGMPPVPRVSAYCDRRNVANRRRSPDDYSPDARASSTLPPACSILAQEKGVLVTDIGQALLDAIADLKADMARRFTAVDERFNAVDKRFNAVDERFNAVDKRFNAVDKRFDAMDKRFNAVDEQLVVLPTMRAQLDGLPLINRAVTVLQQESRSLKAAFNDFALTNTTTGEIQALHDDVNRVQAERISP